MTNTRTSLAALSLLLALLGPGCMEASMSGANALGVTTGGAQDIGYARDIIASGGIPYGSDWSPEGLFSEHDLPLSGPDCETILCPRAQAAVEPDNGSVVVQVGFGTSITADTFERRDLNLGLAVDISGSMSGSKIDSMKVALQALADRMTADDTVSLVVFNEDADLLMEPTVMDTDGLATFRHQIDRLNSGGSTNIEAGLKLAYDQVAPSAEDGGAEDRVMLFTDAQPNVGGTGLSTFTGMARYYGEAGIGLTVFGTGLDLGIELAEEMSEVRGGAYVYLRDEDAIAAAFDEDFDYLVTPLAYDLEVQLTAASGWRFVNAVGAPMDDGAGDFGVAGIDFGASTLFLSSKDGGIAVVLARDPSTGDDGLPSAGDALASFDISYVPADEGGTVHTALDLAYEGGTAWSNSALGDTSPLADDLGVYKMSFLLDEVDALDAAGRFCDGDLTQAEARQPVQDAQARLTAVADQLTDTALTAEATLMGQLDRNLTGGRAQCW
ncbi:MAG: VWA domain-containing protein [Oligoflexia bacterium]|nr:VWA domain-containing protein [Oligoflexia bacterium]